MCVSPCTIVLPCVSYCVNVRPGIALLYLHLHDVFGDASFLAKALDAVGRSLHTLTRRHDVSFLCGDAGPLAVAAAVYHRMQRPHETEECLNRYTHTHTHTHIHIHTHRERETARDGGVPQQVAHTDTLTD